MKSSDHGGDVRLGWWCAGGMVVLAAATVVLPLLMPALAAGLTWERRGRLFAVLGGSFVVALVASGPIADRTHPRPFVVGGNLLVGAGLVLLGVARGFGPRAFACALLGLGAGLLDMVLSPLVARTARGRAAAALNRLHAAYSIGAVGVSALGAAWLRAGLDWRWLPVALLPLPLGIAVRFAGLALPALAERETRAGAVREVLGRPEFRLWALVFFGAGAAMAGLSQWLPALVRAELGASASMGSMALSVFLLGMGGARLIVARWLHGHSPERLLAWGLVATIALGLAGRFVGPAEVGVLALIAVGAPCGILWPTALAAASARIRAGGGALFGWLSAAGNSGCFVAPWLIGLAADRIGLRAALPIAVLPAAVALWRLVQRLDAAAAAESKDRRAPCGAARREAA
ncbi:MAG: hypothetical protein N2652_09065 [Kiritimatiellae bacterium]|nr:hypothetical protein [Kiritimatiellia bacterium]